MNTHADAIDELLAPVTGPDSPGVAVAVARGTETLFAKGYGLANLEYDIPVTPDTVFHVASVSKQFAAFAIALLADRGGIDLDADVRTYLDWFPDFGQVVTTRHLIHHTSGLRDQWELLLLAGWRLDDVITTEDIRHILEGQRELNFPPGSDHLYSNSGYTLLDLIVRNVDGRTLRAFCEEEIFEPLGMHATHFHDDHTEVVPGRAYSYQPAGDGGWRHAVLSYANVGATSLFTTVNDLLLWADNLTTGSLGDANVRNLIHTKAILTDGTEIPYAFGLMFRDRDGLAIVEHGGGDAGFRAHLMRAGGLSVAVLSNGAPVSPALLADSILDILLDRPSAPTEEAQQPDLAPPLADLEGLYRDQDRGLSVRLVVEGNSLAFTGIVRAPVPLERLGAQTFRLPLLGREPMIITPDRLEMSIPGLFNATATRVDDTTPIPTTLAAAAGTYVSPELDVRWRLEAEGDHLVLVRRKYGRRPLQPLGDGVFAFNPTNMFTDGTPLQITLDRRADEVTGFRVSTGRTRRLAFERADD